jgi:phosphate transport system protein
MEREHFSAIFDAELDELRTMLLAMGGKVEMMISGSVKALVDRDTLLAERIVAMDHEVNHLEVTIDEKCLELLALRQPTARDLRFITLALKIVTDLERIGDKCANIAKRSSELNNEPPLKPYIDIPRMAHWTEVMVKEALDAFVRSDADLAIKVCKDDSFVDEINDQIQRELLTFMIEDPNAITRSLKLNYVAKSLERIADHATNIAEMVIFMVKGKDIRHTMA